MIHQLCQEKPVIAIASQIGLLRDPDRPRKLSAEQGQQAQQDPEVRELAAVRSRLCAQIEETFGVIEMAKGEPIYNDYQAVKVSLAATIRKERALLKQIQEEYDLNAPVLAIQQQLNGDQCDDDDDDDDKENAPALPFGSLRDAISPNVLRAIHLYSTIRKAMPSMSSSPSL
ncbi:hypothetical protein ZTR_10340 [Talaromyces verruculosus]|nr:hypothetical protein ZTR_10340 [Talaromyces verruculosus]